MFYWFHSWVITNLCSSSLLGWQWLCISASWLLLAETHSTHTYTPIASGKLENGIRRDDHSLHLEVASKHHALSMKCVGQERQRSSWAAFKGHILFSTEVTFRVCLVEPQQEVDKVSPSDVTCWAFCVETYSRHCQTEAAVQEIALTVRMRNIANRTTDILCPSSSQWQLAEVAPIGCKAAKTHVKVKWARTEQETELPVSHKRRNVLLS